MFYSLFFADDPGDTSVTFPPLGAGEGQKTKFGPVTFDFFVYQTNLTIICCLI